MFDTVGHARRKSGSRVHIDAPDGRVAAGHLAPDSHAFLPQIGKADGRPEEIVFVALAQDKATYRNLAEMPEQEAWYRRFAERVEGDVHWEDVEMEMTPSQPCLENSLSAQGGGSAMATQVRTPWQLRGTVVVACNCEYGCPCNFNARPSHGHCEGGWTWHVTDGYHDDVALQDLNFPMLTDWPAAIHEGNGEALMLIDERADERQRDTIRRFLAGQIGGPWTVFVNTFVRVHGPEFVPYEVSFDEYHSHVRAGSSWKWPPSRSATR